mmetsp:Transcript_116142/g.339638  ORF Transcript_116142/g.339638 Transcript_116142/m.339638 type:complete len:193 (+) Transcript_116142:58-636(+)
MKKHRSGASQSAVDAWKRCHAEKPNTIGGGFRNWSLTKAPPPAGDGELLRSASLPSFETTYSQIGSKQDFDFAGLGDKYRSMSTAFRDPLRFDYLHAQTPLSRSKTDLRSPAGLKGGPPREFRAEGLGDRFGFHSTTVRDPVRWDYLDAARWPSGRSAEIKGRRFELSMLGDKYRSFSTPVSDVARFGFMDS